jgi:hypothetical protein
MKYSLSSSVTARIYFRIPEETLPFVRRRFSRVSKTLMKRFMIVTGLTKHVQMCKVLKYSNGIATHLVDMVKNPQGVEDAYRKP